MLERVIESTRTFPAGGSWGTPATAGRASRATPATRDRADARPILMKPAVMVEPPVSAGSLSPSGLGRPAARVPPGVRSDGRAATREPTHIPDAHPLARVGMNRQPERGPRRAWVLLLPRSLGRRRDVVVDPEEVGGIVRRLDLDQPLVVVARRGPHPICPLLLLDDGEVQVAARQGMRRQRVVELAGPADAALLLGRVVPGAADDDLVARVPMPEGRLGLATPAVGAGELLEDRIGDR